MPAPPPAAAEAAASAVTAATAAPATAAPERTPRAPRRPAPAAAAAAAPRQHAPDDAAEDRAGDVLSAVTGARPAPIPAVKISAGQRIRLLREALRAAGVLDRHVRIRVADRDRALERPFCFGETGPSLASDT